VEDHQTYQSKDAYFKGHNVEEKLAMVCNCDAVKHPGAMAVIVFVSDNYLSVKWQRDFSTYWSCFATQRLQRLQCLLRRGIRSMHFTQKFCSSYFQRVNNSCMTFFCSFSPDGLGTYPGSYTMHMAYKYMQHAKLNKKNRLLNGAFQKVSGMIRISV
jgi:hypothetical protein